MARTVRRTGAGCRVLSQVDGGTSPTLTAAWSTTTHSVRRDTDVLRGRRRPSPARQGEKRAPHFLRAPRSDDNLGNRPQIKGLVDQHEQHAPPAATPLRCEGGRSGSGRADIEAPTLLRPALQDPLWRRALRSEQAPALRAQGPLPALAGGCFFGPFSAGSPPRRRRQFPAVACMEEYLRQFYLLSQGAAPPPVPLPVYIANLVYETPLPPPGKVRRRPPPMYKTSLT